MNLLIQRAGKTFMVNNTATNHICCPSLHIGLLSTTNFKKLVFQL